MALTNNFLPSTNLVFTPNNFASQLAERQKDDRNAVQGALKFGTQLYDFLQSNKQADLMEKDATDKQDILNQIADDQAKLELLKKDLATLQGGV